MLKQLFIAAIFFSLSGCGIYKQSFDCKPGTGVGCKSVSEVNQMVDNGSIYHIETQKKRRLSKRKCKHCTTESHDFSQRIQGFEDGYMSSMPKVYIASYEEDGIYHNEGYFFLEDEKDGDE